MQAEVLSVGTELLLGQTVNTDTTIVAKALSALGINEHTLREHYQIRAVLEGAACAFCCETNADLTGIQNCLDTAAEALAHQDSSHYADLNQSFHYEIWKASGNTKLNNLLGGLWNGLSIGLQSTELEYATVSHREHLQIFESLQKRDADEARRRMEEHIYRSMRDILTRYQ